MFTPWIWILCIIWCSVWSILPKYVLRIVQTEIWSFTWPSDMIRTWFEFFSRLTKITKDVTYRILEHSKDTKDVERVKRLHRKFFHFYYVDFFYIIIILLFLYYSKESKDSKDYCSALKIFKTRSYIFRYFCVFEVNLSHS